MNTAGKSKNREQRDHNHDTLQAKLSKKYMSSVKHKYILLSSAPGVGKTVVAVNLAIALSKMNLNVGLVDANFNNPDIHRTLCLQDEFYLSLKSVITPIAYSDGLKVVSIAGPLTKNEIKKEHDTSTLYNIMQCVGNIDWGKTDCLFFDTSAGPSEELRTVIRSVPDAKIIIVTAPNKIDQKRFSEMNDFIEKEDIRIWGWIENMRGFLCQNCDQRFSTMGTGPVGRAVYLNEIPFLGRIPIDVNIDKTLDEKIIYTEFPYHYGAEPYEMIAERIMVLSKKTINRSQNVKVIPC